MSGIVRVSALHFTASVSARNPHYDVIGITPQIADRWAQSVSLDNPHLKRFVDDAVTLAQKEFAAEMAT
jgi:hypothetical protein